MNRKHLIEKIKSHIREMNENIKRDNRRLDIIYQKNHLDTDDEEAIDIYSGWIVSDKFRRESAYKVLEQLENNQDIDMHLLEHVDSHLCQQVKKNMNEEQLNNVKELVAALRSGEYKQTHGVLCQNGKYCCMGVASHIKDRLASDGTFISEWHNNTFLPDMGWFNEQFGFHQDRIFTINGVDGTLYYHNDEGATFEQIADAIEQEIINK